MMADGEHQAPASPPLPRRGAYNIDFDALDESSNPFEPKVKLGSSPPRTAPAQPAAAAAADVDLCTPRQKLDCSPPGSPRVSQSTNNNNIADDGMQADTEASPSVPSPVNIEQLQSESSRDSAQVTPKKKKIVKKTKLQSKIKTPKSVKPPEEDSSDVPAPPDSLAAPEPEEISSHALPAARKQPPARKKTQSHDLDCGSAKEDQPPGEVALGVHDVGEAPPCEAASEAMASSSEIDHQFVDSDDIDDPRHGKSTTWPAQRATTGNSEWSVDGRLSEGKEDKRSRQPADHVVSSASEVTSPATGSSTRRASSPEATKTTRSRNELPVVNTPPPGKPSEGSSSKHPATRALEAAQADNSLQVLDNKNESSSEEAPFYDAYDYPPVAATTAKLGQKASAEMERAASQDDAAADSKGAVVQLVQVLRYSQSDWNKLKQELELNFQASLLNKERDWSLMLAERDKKIASLEETNRKLKHTNEDMRMIVAEFEKTISQLQAEKEKTKTDSHKAVQNLESERDQAIEDLQSVETAFSDLHRRYEKSKSIIEGFKRNEEQLRQCVEDLQTKLKKSEVKLQALRSQAEDKLDKANEDIEKIKKSTKSDMVRLEAALKKAELRVSGLEESLQRKEKENQELTAICDELISKVGS